MPYLPVLSSRETKVRLRYLLLVVALLFSLSFTSFGQGNGRDTTGTGGNHVITGKIFFPSGRRADGSIQVKLQSFGEGEITAMADSSGSLSFSSLSPATPTR